MSTYFKAETNGFYEKPECPSGCVEITKARHVELLEGESQGKTISSDSDGLPVLIDPPPPTIEQVKAGFVAVIQNHLDAQARAMAYDNIFTAVTYADESAVPKFQTEGAALREWRSLVWADAYAIMADVEAEEIPMPTAEELLAMLPVFEL